MAEPEEPEEKLAGIFGTPRSTWPRRTAVAVVPRMWGFDPVRLWNWATDRYDTVDSPAMLIKWAVDNQVRAPRGCSPFVVVQLLEVAKLVLDQTSDRMTCRLHS